MKWRMMCCHWCGKDQGGPAGIFDARDRGEPIERFSGPEMGVCDCAENPYTAVFEPGKTVGKMVLKTSLFERLPQPDTEWDVL